MFSLLKNNTLKTFFHKAYAYELDLVKAETISRRFRCLKDKLRRNIIRLDVLCFKAFV